MTGGVRYEQKPMRTESPIAQPIVGASRKSPRDRAVLSIAATSRLRLPMRSEMAPPSGCERKATPEVNAVSSDEPAMV